MKLLTWDPALPHHQVLIQNYMRQTKTENNSNAKRLRLDCYDFTNGVLFMITDSAETAVIAVCSCVRYQENGIHSAKIWHRLDMPDGLSMKIMNQFFEPATFNWCQSQKIQHLWATFNAIAPRTATWAATRMGARRSGHRSRYCDDFGNQIRQAWVGYPRLILERYVWQFVIFYSPNSIFFLTRPETEIEPQLKQLFLNPFIPPPNKLLAAKVWED